MGPGLLIVGSGVTLMKWKCRWALKAGHVGERDCCLLICWDLVNLKDNCKARRGRECGALGCEVGIMGIVETKRMKTDDLWGRAAPEAVCL